jgi:hypothetical protein
MGMPKKVSKGQLKAKMMEYFREIEKTGEELIILDNKRPVLKIISLVKKEKKSVEKIFSKYRGKVRYFEDINQPTQDQWEET